MTPDLLEQAFPLHLVIEPGGRILRVSTLVRRLTALAPGDSASERFEVERPDAFGRVDDWSGLVGQLIVLRHLASGTEIRSQALDLGEGHLALVGSPLVRSLDEVEALGLGMEDFAPHDATLDLIATADAQRRTVDQLQRASRDLRRATKSLALRNQELADALHAREQTEAQLIEASRMEALGQLVAGISHDFNNLLVAILGHAEVGADETRDPAAREGFRAIRHAGQRAAALTGRLLAFARRSERGEDVSDLAAVLEDLRELLGRLIHPRVQLRVEIGAPSLPVPLDRTALEQIIVNLAVNASDAMPSGGRLVIEAGETWGEGGSRVVLRVRDTGEGIPDEVLERIFEPLFTTKDKGRGTGLGLATVKGLVDGVGGQIDVHSLVGEGTTFLLHLPRASLSPAAERRSLEPPSTSGCDATILLVEDEASVRRIVARMLGRAGYRVVPVADADAAEEAFDDGIDLLLTDVSMPGRSGAELALRLLARRPSLPVVVMTGFQSDDPALRDLRRRGGHLLPKPFARARLLRTVGAVLDGAEPPTLPSAWGLDLSA